MREGAKADAKCGQVWDDYFANDDDYDRKTESTDYYSAIGGNESKDSVKNINLGELSAHQQTEKMLEATVDYTEYTGQDGIHLENRLSRSLLDDEISPATSPRHAPNHVKCKSYDEMNNIKHSETFDVLVRRQQAKLKKVSSENEEKERQESFESELSSLNKKITAAIDSFHLKSSSESGRNTGNVDYEKSESEKQDVVVENWDISQDSAEWSSKDMSSHNSMYNDESQQKPDKRVVDEKSTFGIANFSESFDYFSPDKDEAGREARHVLKARNTSNTCEGSDITIPERSPSISPIHPDLHASESKETNEEHYTQDYAENKFSVEKVKEEEFDKVWDEKELLRALEDVDESKVVKTVSLATNFNSEDFVKNEGSESEGIAESKSENHNESTTENVSSLIELDMTSKKYAEIRNSNDVMADKVGFQPILSSSEKAMNSLSTPSKCKEFSDSSDNNNYEADYDRDHGKEIEDVKKSSSGASVITDASSATQNSMRSSNTSMNVFNLTRLSTEAQARFDHSAAELGKVVFKESKIHIPSSFVILPYILSRGENGQIVINEKDKALIEPLGERLLDVVRAASFIRKRDDSVGEPGNGFDDYSRNIGSLRRSLEKLFKFYEPHTLRLYLLDEITFIPIVPFTTDEAVYPITIQYETLPKLVPIMHLSILLSKTWNGYKGLTQMITGQGLFNGLPSLQSNNIGSFNTSTEDIDPAMHTDEVRVTREALGLFSPSAYHKEKSKSPEITSLSKIYDRFDPSGSYCGLVRIVDAWGSSLWTTERNLAEIRDDSSPENLLHYINNQRKRENGIRLKEESVSRLDTSFD